MKSIYLSLCLFLTLSVSYAQDLYIADNSYLYARDVVLFVNNDIRLETTTSYLYLRDDAQLLQNTDIKNSDAGELSVYQNQITELYEYSYWASPVGVSTDGTTGNVAFNTTNVHNPTDELDFTNVTSPAYTFIPGHDATATELSSHWIFKLQDGEGYGGWVHVNTALTVDTGYGFTLKGRPNPGLEPKTLDFRGRPNNGNITVSVNYDGTDNETTSLPDDQVTTLIGNPYPSALDLKLFFVNSTDNQNFLDGSIYFWEQKAIGSHILTAYEGGYAIYTPGNLGDLLDNGSYAIATFTDYNSDGGVGTGGSGTSPDFVNTKRRFAAIGQGFLVNSSKTVPFQLGGDAEFMNSMRVYMPMDTGADDGSVFRNPDDVPNAMKAMSHNGIDYQEILSNPTVIPEIRIHGHINDTYYRENLIAFRSQSTTAYDKFSDAISPEILNDDMYLLADNKSLAIKSINYSDDVRIPLVLKASSNNTSFNINIYSQNYVNENIDIYIYDAITNVYTDIKYGNFNITLDEGEYKDRFEVTFSNEESLNNPEVSINDFEIFQNNTLSQLTILNPNGKEVNAVSLFDIAGKLIFKANTSTLNVEYHFSTKSLSDGAYVAVVEVNNQKPINKKVIVKNK